MLYCSLTSSVLLTKIREPPDVTEAHAEPEDGEEELDGAVPGHPGLPRPLLTIHHKSLKLVKSKIRIHFGWKSQFMSFCEWGLCDRDRSAVSE